MCAPEHRRIDMRHSDMRERDRERCHTHMKHTDMRHMDLSVHRDIAYMHVRNEGSKEVDGCILFHLCI